nr:venom protein [Lampona murina]
MKRFSLIIFALAVVLCSCYELANEELSLDLAPKEEGRDDTCLAIGERCYSMCDCCGDRTGCEEGWFSMSYCGGNQVQYRVRKIATCQIRPAYENYI